MNHPNNLVAVAACWSLRRSWATLSRTEDAPDFGTLRSPAAGSVRSAGGHGDPVGSAVLTLGGSGYRDRLIEHTTEDAAAAYWLARSDPAGRNLPPAPMLAALTAVLPSVAPATARDATAALSRADARIRRALRLPADHRPLLGTPACRGCDSHTLRLWTSPPDPGDWVIICVADCRCRGDRCACRMDVRERGLPHVWGGAAALELAQLDDRRTAA